MKTIGLSPKLYPAVLGIVIGVVLLSAGDNTTGVSVLATAAGALGLGAVSKPGVVAMEIGPANDDLLPDPAPDPLKSKPKRKPATKKPTPRKK